MLDFASLNPTFYDATKPNKLNNPDKPSYPPYAIALCAQTGRVEHIRAFCYADDYRLQEDGKERNLIVAHYLHINTSNRDTQEVWNPEQVLAEALAERAEFLKKYPEYQSFQNEIDSMLDKAGSPENRMNVLAILMEAKLIELHGQLRDLNRILLRVQDNKNARLPQPALPQVNKH